MGENTDIFSILREQRYAVFYVWSVNIFNKVRELIELFISNTDIVFR